MNGHFLFAVVALAACPPIASAQRLVLVNPLAIDRQPEVVEVPLPDALAHLHISRKQAASLVALDAASDEQIPLQVYASEPGAPPDYLLLLVQVAAKGETSVAFRVDPSAVPLPALVFGREAPERKDDFAWENELVAYRVYGPALEATGEITSGIDVWSKRVPNFVIDDFYSGILKASGPTIRLSRITRTMARAWIPTMLGHHAVAAEPQSTLRTGSSCPKTTRHFVCSRAARFVLRSR